MDSENILLVVLAAVLLVGIIILLVRQRRRKPVDVPVEEQAPIAFLEFISEEAEQHIFPLNKSYVIVGRDEASDIHLARDLPAALTVSRRHAQIRREDDAFIVEDLGSRNGIKVNGKVTHRNLLRDGYQVTFGNIEFTFRIPKADDAKEVGP